MSGDKLRSPHVSWVFAQLVTFPISGPGATWGWPSQSRLPPCQRLGCRLGRPLSNVPPGRSGPQGGSQVSPPPLGEVSCLWHDGEGNLPTPRACASLLMSTSDSERLACRLGCCLPVADVQHRPTRQRRPSAERSPLGTRTPRARIESPGTGPLRSAPGADVRHSLAQARRSAAAQWRDLSRAVTHRELRAQALGRERRGEAPVSLAFPHALRAYKVKGKVETFL